MTTWRVGVDEEPPAEFLRLLYADDISDDSAGEDNAPDDDCGDESEGDELEDSGDEDDNPVPALTLTSPERHGSLLEKDDPSSPEAPPYSPLTSPERREQSPEMDRSSPEPPPYSPLSSRRREQSPEMEPQAARELERSRSPINFYSLEIDNVVVQMHDGDREPVEEFLAPDSHVLYASQREQERDRDVRNRSVNVRRGGRRTIRGVRGQSGRGRGHPNRGRTRGLQWEVGHPLTEIWMSDQDVPPELVGLAMDVLRSRQRRMEGTARNDERENDERGSESENDDEFLDASEFNWSSMDSFQAEEEHFRPERTGSVHAFESAYEAFRAYWDNDISLIVAETNLYATKITSASFQYAWYNTNSHEILCLFSFWMMLGILKMPTIDSCFSLDPLLKTEIFRPIFTRHRYIHLTRALHFIDTETNSSADRLLRLRPILAHLNSKFQSNYVLNKNICIDESLTLWKGRLNFKQYIRNKASKFGIKTFELCESTTGYLWSFIVYTGKQSATDIRL